MSWVSLSASDGGDSGKNSYKEVAKQAFASPTNLSARLGKRTPSKDEAQVGISASGSFSGTGNRRAPSKINSEDEAEAFHQMFNSTAVKVSKKHAKPPKKTNSGDLGEGLRALARRAGRQYQAELNSTEAEASAGSNFSIGSVSRRTKDLDLAHNDNSFHVIGGLIVEFFQSKQKTGNSDMRLSPQDIAQLDRLAPPRVRASFVEAVRYRFTNTPMDSTSSVHTLARQCHELGLDAEGPQNPLLVAAETEIVISVPRANQKSKHNRASSASSGNASSSESTGIESVTPSGSTPSSHDGHPPSIRRKKKADPGAAESKANFSGIPPPGYIASSHSSHMSMSHPSFAPSLNFPPTIGRPPLIQSGEDPPAGAGSVSTRLTKMGVEVPFGSESESGVDHVSSTESISQSQASSAHKPDPSEGSYVARPPPSDGSVPYVGAPEGSVHGVGSVRTSLTKFGIEMPRYDESISSLHGGGVSVLTDMKSMATSLTRLGVEMPIGGSNSNANRSAASAQSVSGVSNSSGQVSSVLLPGGGGAAGIQPQPTQPVIVAPILSLSRSSKADEDSSVLQVGSTTEYSNTEELAKQQIMAELREATNLMSESKTQEAAKFWRDHVLELEARLRALNGEEASVVSTLDRQQVQADRNVTETAPETQLSGTSAGGSGTMSQANSAERMAATMPTRAEPNLALNKAAMNTIQVHTVTSSPSPAESFHQTMPNQMTTAPQDQAANYDTAAARAPLMIDPSLEGVPMVDVVAPADLPGGYHFEAEIEGRRFLATVPAGGVQKGETFSCYMRDLEKVGSDIPVGRWRDGLFDCCSIGCCHPVIFNALCCPLVLLGQIMTRVGFDFLGRPSLDNSVNGPNTLWTILCFWIFVNLALFSAYNFKWSQGMELSMADVGALAFVNVAYLLFVVCLTSATRGSLREKYYIRESRFHDLEDCCCATFCLPCALCQMARHTADYDAYEGVCCNDTGLPDSYVAASSPADPDPQPQRTSGGAGGYNIV